MAVDPPQVAEHAALSLAMAVVVSSPSPLLLLDGDLNVVAASASFGLVFEVGPDDLVGRPVLEMGGGEWNIPQFRSLLEATASGVANIEAYELVLRHPGRGLRQLVIHAQRLVYLDLNHTRLMVAIADVTDARADEKVKDDALRQNVILLQEVRHRVANSLQIIASVLLHNARKTQSDETRGHLKDAHSRVMSVAALERQLAGTGEGAVELQPYFTSLCESIAASMITDAQHLTLSVTGLEGMIDGRISVSLGLIVTELVINALKHAFPHGRGGRIVVDFEFRGPNWTLSVSDDGVGMPTDPTAIRTGLGTSIVAALAQQLEAEVQTASAHPGTRVSVTHSHIALVAEDEQMLAVAVARKRPAA